MATVKEMIAAGELKSALEQITSDVKSKPADVQNRTLLFELLCFNGNWDRAEKQLEAIGHQSPKAEIGATIYRNNIQAERDRRLLFSNGLAPHFMLEPPSYVDMHLEAVNRIREGNYDEARKLLDRAEEERPALSGKLNGKQFLDFRDYNDLVGPVLELFVKERYTWLPFEQIKRIEIEAPKTLRDLLWPNARVETIDGTIGEVYIPALYEGSCDHPNDQVKLGRMTDWKQLSDELFIAQGLRLLLVDGEDRPLLEARSIDFDPVQTGGQSAPS